MPTFNNKNPKQRFILYKTRTVHKESAVAQKGVGARLHFFLFLYVPNEISYEMRVDN